MKAKKLPKKVVNLKSKFGFYRAIQRINDPKTFYIIDALGNWMCEVSTEKSAKKEINRLEKELMTMNLIPKMRKFT